MNVFITGASSGLGEGLAQHYANYRGIIGLCARRADALEIIAKCIQAAGAKAIIYALDVSDTDAMQVAIKDFIEQVKNVDLVIANAGIGIPYQTLDGDSAAMARLFKINLIGATNTLVPFIPHLINQGKGTLVAVSSLAGFRGLPGRDAYCASKAGVLTFMDALRLELADTQVHAMTLCPGCVHTPATASLPGKLPFVISCEEAVRQMTSAIAQRKKTHVFPWQVKILSFIFKFAGERIIKKLSPPARTTASG